MEEIIKKLEQQDKKLEEIYKTVQKIKIYFLTVLVLSIITFFIPLIGLIFVIPWLLETLDGAYQGLL